MNKLKGTLGRYTRARALRRAGFLRSALARLRQPAVARIQAAEELSPWLTFRFAILPAARSLLDRRPALAGKDSHEKYWVERHPESAYGRPALAGKSVGVDSWQKEK